MSKKIKVKEIAFGRSGDKGDVSNDYVIPYRESDYELLLEKLTVSKVEEAYDELVKGEIKRYEVPGIKAINYVMHEALGGGGTQSLNIDSMGKSRAGVLVDIEIEVPDEYSPPKTIDGKKEWIR
ncbi:AtuA-related protein [Natronorubrum sp. FCH18a]|uniref:AtuA-related protein n=1 Tax=Natronorubrum sp. FCH18a TaxID=3447018 RepID=UPI003F518087